MMAVPIKGIKGIKAIKKTTSPIKVIKTSTSDAKPRRRGSSRKTVYGQRAALNPKSGERTAIPSPSSHLPNDLQEKGEAEGSENNLAHGVVSRCLGLNDDAASAEGSAYPAAAQRTDGGFAQSGEALCGDRWGKAKSINRNITGPDRNTAGGASSPGKTPSNTGGVPPFAPRAVPNRKVHPSPVGGDVRWGRDR